MFARVLHRPVRLRHFSSTTKFKTEFKPKVVKAKEIPRVPNNKAAPDDSQEAPKTASEEFARKIQTFFIGFALFGGTYLAVTEGMKPLFRATYHADSIGKMTDTDFEYERAEFRREMEYTRGEFAPKVRAPLQQSRRVESSST